MENNFPENVNSPVTESLQTTNLSRFCSKFGGKLPLLFREPAPVGKCGKLIWLRLQCKPASLKWAGEKWNGVLLTRTPVKCGKLLWLIVLFSEEMGFSGILERRLLLQESCGACWIVIDSNALCKLQTNSKVLVFKIKFKEPGADLLGLANTVFFYKMFFSFFASVWEDCSR